jgi:hypothetical protein
MPYRNLILLTVMIFSFAAVAMAEEIDLETDLSLLRPYDKATPGLGGTWRPEFLQVNRWSLGIGLIANISNRFRYESTEPLPIPDSLQTPIGGWKYINDNHLEVADFDFHLEARWRGFGLSDYEKWKGWLTLNLGYLLNTGAITQFQTQYRDSANYVVNGPLTYVSSYTSPTRKDPYISPGILVGIGNWIIGYRQWFYFDNFTIRPGEAGRLRGSLRLGYRFQW